MLKLIVGFVLSLALQAAGQTCTNTCKCGSDGNCDDGGPGREYSDCAFGTDCLDCGPRNQAPPPAPQPFCTNQLNSGLLYSNGFPGIGRDSIFVTLIDSSANDPKSL